MDYQAEYRRKLVTVDDVLDSIQSGCTLTCSQAANDPTAILDRLLSLIHISPCPSSVLWASRSPGASCTGPAPNSTESIHRKRFPPMAELVYDNSGRLLFTKEMKEEYLSLIHI